MKSRPKKNRTIVRPVISFSNRRFDLFMYIGSSIISKGKNKEKIVLPIDVKNITEGFEWAGNAGRLIGNLLLDEEALGEIYIISSGQNISWGELADICCGVFGTNINWVSMEDFKSIKVALIYEIEKTKK